MFVLRLDVQGMDILKCEQNCETKEPKIVFKRRLRAEMRFSERLKGARAAIQSWIEQAGTRLHLSYGSVVPFVAVLHSVIMPFAMQPISTSIILRWNVVSIGVLV